MFYIRACIRALLCHGPPSGKSEVPNIGAFLILEPRCLGEQCSKVQYKARDVAFIGFHQFLPDFLSSSHGVVSLLIGFSWAHDGAPPFLLRARA